MAEGGVPLKCTSESVSFVMVPNRIAVEPDTRICDRATIAPLLSPVALMCAVGGGTWWLSTLWAWSIRHHPGAATGCRWPGNTDADPRPLTSCCRTLQRQNARGSRDAESSQSSSNHPKGGEDQSEWTTCDKPPSGHQVRDGTPTKAADGRQAVPDLEIAWAVWKDLYSVSSFPEIPPRTGLSLSLIHISEPTRRTPIS